MAPSIKMITNAWSLYDQDKFSYGTLEITTIFVSFTTLILITNTFLNMVTCTRRNGSFVAAELTSKIQLYLFLCQFLHHISLLQNVKCRPVARAPPPPPPFWIYQIPPIMVIGTNCPPPPPPTHTHTILYLPTSLKWRCLLTRWTLLQLKNNSHIIVCLTKDPVRFRNWVNNSSSNICHRVSSSPVLI